MSTRLFISYSHRDAHYLERLHVHLAQAMRDGVFQGWYDREITAGSDIDDEVERELELADIFVALVSPDFIASAYCYEKELRRALERRSDRSMIVVPVIVEACDWQETPLGKLKALPSDGKPIAEWTNENVAFTDVVRSLRSLVTINEAPIETKAETAEPEPKTRPDTAPAQRYRAKRKFSRIEKDQYADGAFETVRLFFESSVEELNCVEGLRARLVVHSPVKFSCTVENRAYDRAETVWIRHGGVLGAMDFAYGRYGNDPGDNVSNGGFSVEADEFELFLRPVMFYSHGGRDGVDPEGAARMIWDDLLEHVGIESA